MSFPTASAALVTRAMAEFRSRFPNIELHFSEGEPEESIPALTSGEIDLAVTFDYPAFPEEFGRDTEQELILEEPMRIALAPGHPLAASKKVKLSALADEEWLCGDKPSSCREHVFKHCRAAGFEPRISFESDDYQVLQGLVAAGLGVTLLPDLARRVPAGRASRHAPETPKRRVWAVTRESAPVAGRRGDGRRPPRVGEVYRRGEASAPSPSTPRLQDSLQQAARPLAPTQAAFRLCMCPLTFPARSSRIPASDRERGTQRRHRAARGESPAPHLRSATPSARARQLTPQA